MKNWQRKLMRNATNLVLQTLVTKMVFKMFEDKNEPAPQKHRGAHRIPRKR
ncbi:hypothetical protein [Limosilactobacillus caccae]|uniref:hypothetical protein n=1 Tax=Limosilactobacillus caccae TaxID=1926284 RepID=UPI0013563722|nr:hypothetical protein [Limosilactobacillus caccae]